MPGAISDVQNRDDGNMYYVIGSAASAGGHITIVTTISERNALDVNGFVMVKNAYLGDPTVTKGWAMYIADGVSTTTTSKKWIKVAEEESVDGPWGVQQEILDMLVRKATFTEHVNQNAAEHAQFRAYGELIDQMRANAHSHANKSVIDGLTDGYGQLYYRGKPIGGGAYVYNHVANGTQVWSDPTGTDPVLVEVLNSVEIAKKFATTSLAFEGQTLHVVEVDQSISTFIMAKNEDGSLRPVFVGSVGGSIDQHAVRFVQGLPAASPLYYQQGTFFLMAPGLCGNKVGHFYVCDKVGDEFVWVDLNEKLTNIDVNGAKITTCWRSDWNTVNVTWEDPESIVDSGFGKVKFDKTYLVRKFGSAPKNMLDGVVVCVEDIPNKHKTDAFIDVCPLSHMNVFYSVFTVAANGATYKIPVDDNNVKLNMAKARFIDWDYLKSVFMSGNIRSVLKLGDILSLPYHDVFGQLDVVVSSFSEGKVYLTCTKSIGKFVYDAEEYGMKPTTDTTYQSGKEYYSIERNGNQVTYKQLLEDNDWEAGDTVASGTYEWVTPEQQYGEAYDPDTQMCHGSSDWFTSNLRQWLNSNQIDWYSARPHRDDAGQPDPTDKNTDDAGNVVIPGDGFLKGFESEKFWTLVKKVELPSEVSGLQAEDADGNKILGDKIVWAQGPASEGSRKAATIANGSVTVEGEFPETKQDVIPVFVISE